MKVRLNRITPNPVIDETDDYPDDEYSEDDFSASADEAYSVEERYADYGDEPDEACSFSDDELLGGSGWF